MSFLSPFRILFNKSLITLKLCRANVIVGKNFSVKINSRINTWLSGGSIRIADDVSIGGYNSELYVWHGHISIGNNTSFGDNCKIYENVKIGSNCLFASNIYVSSGVHSIKKNDSLPIRSQDKIFSEDKPVIIEDDCWIGFGVVIMPGIYIGKGAVIGSNSVVTKNVFPYTVNAGVPARKINMRVDFSLAYNEILSFENSHWPFFYRGINYGQFEEIETLKEGFEVLLKTSLFLLKRSDVLNLEITGFCYESTNFKILLNGNLVIELEIGSGEFYINKVLQEYNTYISEYDEIPTDIKTSYNIIGIIAEVKSINNLNNKCLWKVKSVKIS